MNEIFKKTEMNKLLRSFMAKKNDSPLMYDAKNNFISDGHAFYKIDDTIINFLSDKVELGVSILIKPGAYHKDEEVPDFMKFVDLSKNLVDLTDTRYLYTGYTYGNCKILASEKGAMYVDTKFTNPLPEDIKFKTYRWEQSSCECRKGIQPESDIRGIDPVFVTRRSDGLLIAIILPVRVNTDRMKYKVEKVG